MAMIEKRIMLLGFNIEKISVISKYIETKKEYEPEAIQRLSDALERVYEEDYACVLINCDIDKKAGAEAVSALRARTTRIPLIIIAEEYDEKSALQAIRHGAHDYLSIRELDETRFFRSIKCAIERHKVRAGLYNMALIDELTGLYNRRGFMILAAQHMALAKDTLIIKGLRISGMSLTGMHLK